MFDCSVVQKNSTILCLLHDSGDISWYWLQVKCSVSAFYCQNLTFINSSGCWSMSNTLLTNSLLTERSPSRVCYCTKEISSRLHRESGLVNVLLYVPYTFVNVDIIGRKTCYYWQVNQISWVSFQLSIDIRKMPLNTYYQSIFQD